MTFPVKGFLAAFLLAFVSVASAGGIDSSGADPGADEAWRAFEAAVNELPAPDDKRSALQWREYQGLKTRELGLAFIEQYPADPRRWAVVVSFPRGFPRFIKEWGPTDEKGRHLQPVVDEAAAAQWQARLKELRAALGRADDVTPAVREIWATQEEEAALWDAMGGMDSGMKPDMPALRARLQAFAASYPRASGGGKLLSTYINLFGLFHPEQVEAEWQIFASSPNTSMRELGKNKAMLLTYQRKPLDLAFTAVDGREVDVAKLRGKVVLVEFWATWCGPCKEEIPNLKKLYAAYHAQGFEIAGLALENAGLSPQDPPEQTARKLEKSRKILSDFIARHDMPWPQYFDGNVMRGEIATRFGITGIPAMFLLDREGRIASTSARGPSLEQEVRRLLGL